MSRGTAAAAYQLAGALLLADDMFTKGQRSRMRELLLNVLSQPERYTGRLVADLHRLAIEP
jgi:hypothetical protein